jgi:hypothetical protein
VQNVLDGLQLAVHNVKQEQVASTSNEKLRRIAARRNEGYISRRVPRVDNSLGCGIDNKHTLGENLQEMGRAQVGAVNRLSVELYSAILGLSHLLT